MAELATPLRFLKGAGPARARLLERLELRTYGDLLEHYPRAYLDRTRLVPLGSLQPGTEATAVGWVRSVSPHRVRGGRQDLHAILDDGAGCVECVWFNQPYLAGRIRRGVRLLVSGRVEFYRRLRFNSPEWEVLDGPPSADEAPGIVPIYPATAGLTQRALRLWVRQALAACEGELTEILPEETLARHRLPSWREAHRQIHFPGSQPELEAARRRIAFQELFDLQLLLAFSRQSYDQPQTARPLIAEGRMLAALRRHLPFALTGAQERAVAQIAADLARDRPMHRLLEGDVGSGKTLVALAATLHAVEAGAQVAFMAPTEILASQHARTLERYGAPLGLRAAYLSGGLAARRAAEVREAASRGETHVLLGTHALVQETVSFAALGLVIVDEQHRFGVMQRARLLGKGRSPHGLIMTATPIPRTLALTLFGDLDLTVLDEVPPGRRPPRTHLVPEERRAEMLAFVGRTLREGAQAYFVAPMIEASEDSDLAAAEDLFERLLREPALQGLAGALLHGRMRAEEKDRVMQAFGEGRISFLVATTVIEVGVDVPNASLMVVEHPERYGLSQLHQLRGRVGRGRQPAHLFLVRRRDVGPEARRRMEILARETDGFRIAEEDLRLRGPGEFFGVRQSGLPPLKVADPVGDPGLLARARQEALDLVRAAGGEGLRATPMWRRLEARFGERLTLYGVG
jgi:ATP-dependent DNA helicase RecG